MVFKLKKPDWLTRSRIVIAVLIILAAIALDSSLSFTRLMNWLGAIGFVGSLILLVFNKSASTKLLAALIISMSLVVYTTGIISWRSNMEPMPISYQVVEWDDVTSDETKRFVLHVVVNEPTTVEQLQKVAELVVDGFREESVGALRLQFYDYEDYIGLNSPLGYAVYAPNGLWSQASAVAGDESGPMTFAWHLYEKDWALRLSSQGAQAVALWHERFTTADPHLDKSEISREVAATLGLGLGEVENALEQFARWTTISD